MRKIGAWQRFMVIIPMVLVGILLIVLLHLPEGSGDTFIVDDDGDSSGALNFSSINEAIKYAYPGDVIRVYDGTYYETVKFDVNENITLIGNGSATTILDLRNRDDGIIIEKRGIRISHLQVRNGGRSTDWRDPEVGIDLKANDSFLENIIIQDFGFAGVRLLEVRNITIANLTCEDIAGDGILLANLPGAGPKNRDITIRDSKVWNNEGDGISTRSHHNLTIDNVEIESNSRGIYGRSGDLLTIKNSLIRNNQRSGIELDWGREIEIRDNGIIGNDYGVHVTQSFHFSFTNNDVIGNQQMGLYIRDVYHRDSQSELRSQNTFEGNRVDVFIDRDEPYEIDPGVPATVILLVLLGAVAVFLRLPLDIPILRSDAGEPLSPLTDSAAASPSSIGIHSGAGSCLLRHPVRYSFIHYLILTAPFLIIGLHEDWMGYLIYGLVISIPLFISAQGILLSELYLPNPPISMKNRNRLFFTYLLTVYFLIIFLSYILNNVFTDVRGPVEALAAISCCGLMIGLLAVTIGQTVITIRALGEVRSEAPGLKRWMRVFQILFIVHILVLIIIMARMSII